MSSSKKEIRAVIRKSKNDEFYFAIVANNGKTIVHSETYKRKQSALHAIELLNKSVLRVVDETVKDKE